jgi:transposase|tara:strand:+ start:38 stop:1630 length:1593 start_codon:yes stop_codon:yes gene_type:complete
MNQAQNNPKNKGDVVPKKDYDLLEKKYQHSVESYDQLLHQFKQLQRAKFGSKSERFTEIFDGQQALFESKELEGSQFDSDEDDDDDPDPKGGIPVKGHSRQSKNKISSYDHLPTKEEIIPVDSSDKVCSCGCQKTVVGYEAKWILCHRPAQFSRLCQKREKVSCPRCKDGISTAASVPHILPKSEVSEDLLAHIVISKCIDRQPLYHMEKYWNERFGVKISRQTMARWVIDSSKRLMPLVNLFKETILDYHLSTIDATKLQVLKEEGRNPTISSYMYCIRGGPPNKRAIIYDYNATQQKVFVETLYSDYQGYIQSDAERIFVNLEQQDGITMSYCNAHARRKFEPLARASTSKGLAYTAMMYFKTLYKIEAKAKAEKMSYEARLALRQEKSKPIVDQFHQWLIQAKELSLPQSPLGKAIAYSLNHWAGLTQFLENGEAEIDNNATEREIKVLVMARKNFLFANSVEGADALGIYFSMIQTARAHNVEPGSYLAATFKAIPRCKSFDDYEDLLPWNFAKKNLGSDQAILVA